MNNSYTLWNFIKYEVSQKSVLGPILFNMFLFYMFFVIDMVDIPSYADNNTPLHCREKANVN